MRQRNRRVIGLSVLACSFTALLGTACNPETQGARPTMVSAEGEVVWESAGPIEGCYSNTVILGGNPHMVGRNAPPTGNPPYHRGSEYCITSQGRDYFLEPRDRLDWYSCDDDSRKLKLTQVAGNHFTFCAKVRPHMGGHPAEHMSFEIEIYPGTSSNDAYIANGRECPPAGSCEDHGGSAHSLN